MGSGDGWRPSPRRGSTRRPARRFGEMVRRRVRREPVAYILGRKGFRGLELAVDGRALIPRPETELLVEIALELAAPHGARRRHRVRRRGAGGRGRASRVRGDRDRHLAGGARSGARERRAARDRRPGPASSAGPCPTAGGSSWCSRTSPTSREDEWQRLAPEITRYEPREALVAGADGVEAIASTVPAALAALEPGASLALEVGAGQAGPVAELLVDLGFRQVEGRPDLAGIPRVVLGQSVTATVSIADDGADACAPGARALRRRGWRRGLPGGHALRAGLRPIERRGDRADSLAEGPRRGQAVGGDVLRAPGHARAAGRRSGRAPATRSGRCSPAR